MAKAKASPSVDTWPAEGLPIDAACKLIAPSAWDAFVSAWRAAARDLDDRHKITLLSLPPDVKRRLARYKEAQTALDLERDGFELWARPGSPIAEFERIPPSAVSGLELDPESRTARGKNIPPLYDVHLRRVPRADVLALLPGSKKPRSKKPRRRPRVDKYEPVVRELWPDGVPPETILSTAEALQRLGKELQDRGIPCGSDTLDSQRRALGRR